MAWQTPKTNWQSADGVRDTDFNRIEGNTLELRNQAMLMGVYQTTAAALTTKTAQSFVTNPIPTTWTAVNSSEYYNGGYRIKSTSSPSAQPVSYAFDASTTTYCSAMGTEAYVQVELPSAILVDAFRLSYTVPVATTAVRVLASNDGSSWTTIYTAPTVGSVGTLTEVSMTDPGVYKFYRLSVTMSSSGSISVYAFQISDYTVTTYEVKHTLTLGATLVANQHVYITTPTNYNMVGVNSNTLNNINVNALMNPGRRYRLIYTGTSFIATEVT